MCVHEREGEKLVLVKWLAERTANLANGRNKLAEKKKVEEEKDRGKIIMVVPILLFPPALTLVLAITLTGSLPSLPPPASAFYLA